MKKPLKKNTVSIRTETRCLLFKWQLNKIKASQFCGAF
jgi:hypothetical protein